MTPKTLTCVIVDDETANLELLSSYVKQISHLELKATFNKSIDALAYLLKNPTDLLITDIDMPRLSGIELYESVYNNGTTQVIFISGNAHKIFEAISYCVTDYLPKPVSIFRFEQSMQKVLFFANNTHKNYDDIPTEILERAFKCYNDLTETEKKILALITKGNSTFAITQLLNNSRKTIDTHRHTIRKKLKLNPENSLTQIARFVMERIK
jgi:DNA-binding NarL/FixJ family response regulator